MVDSIPVVLWLNIQNQVPKINSNKTELKSWTVACFFILWGAGAFPKSCRTLVLIANTWKHFYFDMNPCFEESCLHSF